MTFTGICIITEDVPRLARFYQDILDVQFEINDIHVEVKVDGSYFAIYSKEAAVKDMGFDLAEVHGTGNLTLMFKVDDVDREYQRLKALVPSFMTTPKTYPWGSRAVHFRDPDGNIVDFVSRG